MTTVLAHGCFDLLHLGHIRHLQEARSLGDRLVVSITDDKYVAKGMGRPRFPSQQRAEALRSLACVDEVIIADEPGAIGVIRKVKPAVYVKGIDYSNGLTQEENEAIAAVGGRIHITSSEKLSSSRLINAERFSPEVISYLERAKNDGALGRIKDAFTRADEMKIAFIGEQIIDEYRYVRGLGRPSKEFMLASVETGTEAFAGGVVAASKHAEWDDSRYYTVSDDIKKTRYVDKDFNRKLFDVYSKTRLDISPQQAKDFHWMLRTAVRDADVVIVLDFGHGLIGGDELAILKDAKLLAVNAQTNAGNYGFNLITKYKIANYVCIDDPEARLAAGMADDPIEEVAASLMEGGNNYYSSMIITHGKFGSYFRNNVTRSHLPQLTGTAPAFSTGGVDTMGAGDAVMAVTAPLIAAGLLINDAALVGNVAGAIKTSIIGHRRHVGRQEIIQTVEALLA